MKTRYYEGTPILKEALCDNCGEILNYTRTDFKRGALAWLHKCNRCGKYYWLDNRYPCTPDKPTRSRSMRRFRSRNTNG